MKSLLLAMYTLVVTKTNSNINFSGGAQHGADHSLDWNILYYIARSIHNIIL